MYDLSDIIKYLYPMSAVGVFARFEYPNVVSSYAGKLLELRVLFRITFPVLVLDIYEVGLGHGIIDI